MHFSHRGENEVSKVTECNKKFVVVRLGTSPTWSCQECQLYFLPGHVYSGGWDKVSAHVVQLTFHRYSAQ